MPPPPASGQRAVSVRESPHLRGDGPGGSPAEPGAGATGRFDTGRQDVTKATKDELPLDEQTTRRLLLAGIQPDDPGLEAIRKWNARAYERAGLPNPHDRDGTP